MSEAILKREPWWSVLLRGIFILIFFIIAFAWPGITIALLAIFFGAFVLVDGLFATVVSMMKRKQHKHWWLTLLGGLVGIVIGILAFVGMATGWFAVFYLIAAWFLVTGIIRIFAAIRTREEGVHRLRLTLGIVSACIGIAIFIMSISIPALLATLWIIALFALIVGVFLLADAFQERKRIRETTRLHA